MRESWIHPVGVNFAHLNQVSQSNTHPTQRSCLTHFVARVIDCHCTMSAIKRHGFLALHFLQSLLWRILLRGPSTWKPSCLLQCYPHSFISNHLGHSSLPEQEPDYLPASNLGLAPFIPLLYSKPCHSGLGTIASSSPLGISAFLSALATWFMTLRGNKK